MLPKQDDLRNVEMSQRYVDPTFASSLRTAFPSTISTFNPPHSMSFRSLLVVSVLSAFLAVPGFAQINAEGALTFTVGVPQGEFSDHLDATGFGINANAAIGFPGSPILLGIDGGYLIYGHERRNEPFSTTIPDVTVDVVTDNSVATGHLFLRLKPNLPGFQPYGDALFGFKYFFTQTRIESDAFDQNEITRSTNFEDTALSYGFGGGVKINLFTPTGNNGPGGVHLDVGARYLIGKEAEYLKEGSIRREGGRVTFDVTNSDTTMLLVHFGIGVTF